MRRAQGHKASFCLEDTECDPGFEKRWNCTRGGDQGLSPGCFDIYSSKIDCQWVDCTGISGGSFHLRVQLNPGNQVAESDFKNNVAKCTVYDYRSFIIADKCWIGKLYVKIVNYEMEHSGTLLYGHLDIYSFLFFPSKISVSLFLI